MPSSIVDIVSNHYQIIVCNLHHLWIAMIFVAPLCQTTIWATTIKIKIKNIRINKHKQTNKQTNKQIKTIKPNNHHHTHTHIHTYTLIY